MKDLLTISQLSRDDFADILDLAERTPGELGRPLDGKGVALLFQKPSSRTRNSVEMAAVQLGGHPVYLTDEEMGLGRRETAEDVGRTLSCFHAAIGARVTEHGALVAMAAAAEAPVVNLLSDTDHPLQALADLLTVKQLLGRLEGAKIAYVGDANNVARSLAQGSSLTGVELVLACPDEYCFADEDLARWPGVTQTADPAAAVAGAQAVYTDVWVSMGQVDSEARRKAFADFQVDEALMAASADAWFLHCLPARRGEEVAAAVIDGPRSAVWRQAENRMHSARGALAWMLGSSQP
ncbi:MAG: ornithine carbamoyltransferase [Sphingosinicella sp.]